MAAMQISNTMAMTAPRRSSPAFRSAMAPKVALRKTVARAAAAKTAPAKTEQKEWYALAADQELFLNDVQNEAIVEQLLEREWYALVANQEFFFNDVQNEAIVAQLREREWYALVANQEFFFNDVQNEAIAEQLRERVRFFNEQEMENDFYLVPNPVWLDAKYPAQAKQVQRPCVALVSTDKDWIIFMKLRLDRVLKIDLGDMDTVEVLKAGSAVVDPVSPEKWTAPYAPYSKGWWDAFVPK
eukprot:gene19283-25924_t